MHVKSNEFINRIRTIKLGDDDWLLTNGLVCSPRAGFEINRECPENYKQVIQQCIEYGWLKPVAYMYDSELVWEKLSS